MMVSRWMEVLIIKRIIRKIANRLFYHMLKKNARIKKRRISRFFSLVSFKRSTPPRSKRCNNNACIYICPYVYDYNRGDIIS